ncbi:hypothetical protein [Propioniciclava sinopodophylli]|uniref:hypothetical protein n=1 Tax=Propioniciclava sinopodophylli TaxID=1837344 RepID=UPI002493B729|nr:hypothetical protein [Propioniciclava sinopodophylli]
MASTSPTKFIAFAAPWSTSGSDSSRSTSRPTSVEGRLFSRETCRAQSTVPRGSVGPGSAAATGGGTRTGPTRGSLAR